MLLIWTHTLKNYISISGQALDLNPQGWRSWRSLEEKIKQLDSHYSWMEVNKRMMISPVGEVNFANFVISIN